MKISTILLIILLVGCQEEAPIQSEFSIRRDVGVLRLEDAASSEGDVPIQVDAQGKLMATCSNKKCLNMLCVFDEKMKLNCECKKEIK